MRIENTFQKAEGLRKRPELILCKPPSAQSKGSTLIFKDIKLNGTKQYHH